MRVFYDSVSMLMEVVHPDGTVRRFRRVTVGRALAVAGRAAKVNVQAQRAA
jgi:hypothetical protein